MTSSDPSPAIGFWGATPVPIGPQTTLAHHCLQLNAEIRRLKEERSALLVELDVAYAALAALKRRQRRSTLDVVVTPPATMERRRKGDA